MIDKLEDIEIVERIPVIKSASNNIRPFLVLNDDYASQDKQKAIFTQLDSLKQYGFTGIYIHPRPGLLTEYLSVDWFTLVTDIILYCKKIGLAAGLYDENSYPSGFAGGHVPSVCPQGVSKYVIPIFGKGRASLPGTYLTLHRWADNHRFEPLSHSDIDPELA